MNLLYEKLDELSAEQQRATQVGGDGAVVLVEMYPDCLNRLSPDTTDQPHAHRILMLADTKVNLFPFMFLIKFFTLFLYFFFHILISDLGGKI